MSETKNNNAVETPVVDKSNKPTPAPVVKPAAPVVTKVAEPIAATTPASPTPEQIAESREVAVVTELLDSYKTSLAPTVVTELMHAGAARALSSVMRRIIQNPMTATMDVVWKFFVDHQATFLQESTALSGISTIPANARSQTELAYVLFRKATKGIDVGDNRNVNKVALVNILKCPKLVAYLSAKSKTVQIKK